MSNFRFKIGDPVKAGVPFTGTVDGVVHSVYEKLGSVYYELRYSDGSLGTWPSDNVYLPDAELEDPCMRYIYY